MTNDSIIGEQLKHLPSESGVYLFRDSEGNIIYVGKATNLRHRVSSYFGLSQKLSEKIIWMVSRIHDMDFFITSSEQEALILELNLIKKHRPRFNVRLKDDKTFPYLKIDLRNDWPRVYMTRRLEQDNAYYFGPFASAKSVRQTIKVIKEIFPFRSCTKPITGADSRACLEYDIGRCLGPCIGAVTQKEHSKLIRQVMLFLEGKQERIVRDLEARMLKASEALEFEKAALLRDRLEAIYQVIEGQRIAAKVKGEQDAIAFTLDNDQAYVQVFFIRNGKLIGRESFLLQGTSSETPEQIMTSFVQQFYNSAPNIPPVILLQYPVGDFDTIIKWLESRRNGKVHLLVPRRGAKKELIDIVVQNAVEGLEQLKIRQTALPMTLASAMDELKKELKLPLLPARIEGYDISDIQGKLAVGSMVVFEDGKPKPSQYRRFKIKSVPWANDYAMLQEVLRRRFRHAGDPDNHWPAPDLILIDGGKGQLNAAATLLQEIGAADIPLASLAKEHEQIFLPGHDQPLALSRSSPGLQLLQRVRDESHRFALGYHHKLRQKEGFTSALDSIPGIGPRRKHALLQRFGSVGAIAQASVEELVAIPGITRELAEKIKEYL